MSFLFKLQITFCGFARFGESLPNFNFLIMFPSTRPIFDLSLPPKSCKTAVVCSLFYALLLVKFSLFSYFRQKYFIMFNFIYTTEYITKKCLKDKEDLTQNLIWFTAFATFIINLMFQIFNSIFKC